MTAGRRSGAAIERRKYHQGRLRDAARLIPLLGVGLLALPMLWPTDADPGAATARAAEPVLMSTAVLYVFGIWAGLIVLGVFFGRYARRWSDDDFGRDAGNATVPDAGAEGGSAGIIPGVSDPAERAPGDWAGQQPVRPD